MATYTVTLLSPWDVTNLTTPGPAGAFPNTGDEFRLKSDWSNSTDARTMTVTDDDDKLNGDPAESTVEDTSQQTATVTDPSGSTITSGNAIAEYAFEMIGPGNVIVTVHSIYVGNTLVGYAADGPVQPGANYKVTNFYQPNGAAAPSYSSFDQLSYEQDPENKIRGTDREDRLAGGEGSDAIGGEGGDDDIYGGNDADYVAGGAGNDSVYGGAGNDTVYGEDGDDIVVGDGGNDTIFGGAGNDTLIGGSGDDTITTGTGDDLVVIDQSQGSTTVTDFDIGDADGDGKSNDQLDVSELLDQSGNPVTIMDVVVSDDGFGNALLTFPKGETLILQGVSPDQMSRQQMAASGIPCYAPGTMIDTPTGARPVETLKPGDLVMTLDHGPQPIRWTRSGDQPLEEADIDHKPVLIAAGALGEGRPHQDLIVSPQHRIIVGGGGQLEDWFNTEAFAPSKSLTGLRGIRHMKGKKAITWIHFACERHEVISANGCQSESLLLGPVVLNGLTHLERKTLMDSFGTATKDGSALNGPAARTCLKVSDARRHLTACRDDSRKRNANEIAKWNDDLANEQWEMDELEKLHNVLR